MSFRSLRVGAGGGGGSLLHLSAIMFRQVAVVKKKAVKQDKQ